MLQGWDFESNKYTAAICAEQEVTEGFLLTLAQAISSHWQIILIQTLRGASLPRSKISFDAV